MESKQAIANPLGVTTHGTATCRVAPDHAVIKCAVTRLETTPDKAFAKARQGAQAVQACLRQTGSPDFGTSRITLAQQNRFVNGENKFIGYLAKVAIRVTLADLDRIEETVSALVTAGANEIESVSFESSRITEIRNEARKLAVAAAFEKAQVYCKAAGIQLGHVLHIEDVSPFPRFDEMARGAGAAASDDSGGGAFDPSLLSVSANVLVAYGIRGLE